MQCEPKKDTLKGKNKQLKQAYEVLKDKHAATKNRLEMYVNRLETDNRKLNQELVELRFERAGSSDQLLLDQFQHNLLKQPKPACLLSAEHSCFAALADLHPVQSTMLDPPVRPGGKKRSSSKPAKPRPFNAWNEGRSPKLVSVGFWN